MSKADDLFVTMCTDILENGTTTEGQKVRPHWEDGTPAFTIKQFGVVNRYDLRDEFPALTLRRTALKSCMDEVLWIYQKKSNNIHDLASHIWDEWADETGSIGKAYGYQIAQKSHYPEGDFDQMDRVLFDLERTPYSRRIMTNTYVFHDLSEMNLYPCAYSCTYNVTQHAGDAAPTLNLLLNQRSQDILAANNWNVCQYAILLMMVSRHMGMIPGQLVHVIADAHIYDRHVDIVRELISRPHFPAPSVTLNPDKLDFYSFTTDDLIVENYQHVPDCPRLTQLTRPGRIGRGQSQPRPYSVQTFVGAPRAQFTSTAPSRIAEILSASNQPRVESLSGTWRLTMSDSASSCPSDTCSMPASAAAALSAGVKAHMVDARERHGDHLERVRGAHDLGRIRVVRDHHHLGPRRTTCKLGRVGRLLVVVGKLMARCLDGRGQLANRRLRHPQRLKQHNLHVWLQSPCMTTRHGRARDPTHAREPVPLAQPSGAFSDKSPSATCGFTGHLVRKRSTRSYRARYNRARMFELGLEAELEHAKRQRPETVIDKLVNAQVMHAKGPIAGDAGLVIRNHVESERPGTTAACLERRRGKQHLRHAMTLGLGVHGQRVNDAHLGRLCHHRPGNRLVAARLPSVEHEGPHRLRVCPRGLVLCNEEISGRRLVLEHLARGMLAPAPQDVERRTDHGIDDTAVHLLDRIELRRMGHTDHDLEFRAPLPTISHTFPYHGREAYVPDDQAPCQTPKPRQ